MSKADPDEKIFLRRTEAGFVPAFDRDREMLSHIPLGAVISTIPKNPRNPRRLRWWWALVGKIAENHPTLLNGRAVTRELKHRLGYVDPYAIVRADGTVEVHYEPQSIAYDAMSEKDFAEFCDRALDVVAAEMLPGIEREDLRREIEQMIGPEEPKRRRAA